MVEQRGTTGHTHTIQAMSPGRGGRRARRHPASSVVFSRPSGAEAYYAGMYPVVPRCSTTGYHL